MADQSRPAIRTIRTGQGFVYRPAPAYPMLNRVSRDVDDSTPLANGVGFAVQNKEAILAGVVQLFGVGGPFAVVGRIAFIVVDSLKGVFRRGRLAHIREKVAKVLPSLAHGNASLSVVLIASAIRIAAPLKHRQPSSVNLRSRITVFSYKFAVVAAARFSRSVAERVTENRLFGSAFTTAKPLPISGLLARGFNDAEITQNNPSSEPLAGQIFANPHMFILTQNARIYWVLGGFGRG
jgi:hypothetical protein